MAAERQYEVRQLSAAPIGAMRLSSACHLHLLVVVAAEILPAGSSFQHNHSIFETFETSEGTCSSWMWLRRKFSTVDATSAGGMFSWLRIAAASCSHSRIKASKCANITFGFLLRYHEICNNINL